MTDTEDPWAKAREALASAGSQAKAATIAISSTVIALTEAATAAPAATGKSAYRAIEPSMIEAFEALNTARQDLLTSLTLHPEVVPLSCMFMAAFFVLFIASRCLRWRLRVFRLLLVAAAMAIPYASDAIVAAVASVIALAFTSPAVSEASTSIQTTLQSLSEHPHAMAATALTIAARNASVAFASSAWEIAAKHPHVEVVLSNEKVLAYMEATLAHPHAARLTAWLTTVLACTLAIGSLRCCCGLGGCLRGGGRARGAEQDAEAARRAAKKERQKERQREIKELNEKKAKKGSLRGVSEASLRDTTRSVPGTVDLLAAPIKAVVGGLGTCVRFLVGLASQKEEPPLTKSLHGSSASGDGTSEMETDSTDDGRPSLATSRASSGRQPSGKKNKPAAPLITHPRLMVTLKGFAAGESVTSAALSQDGSMAAAVSTDRTLRIFQGLNKVGEKSAVLPPQIIANIPLDHGTALSLAPNGRNVVIATCQSRKVLAYSITPKLAVKRSFPAAGSAHPRPMCSCLLAPNSKYILTVGSESDLSAKIWTLGGELIDSVETKHVAQFGGSISADSCLIALACTSAATPSRSVAPAHGQVPVFQVDFTTGGEATGLTQVLNVAGHTRGVTSIAFAQDCVHLAVASHDCEWSVVSTDVRYDLKVPAKEKARGGAPNGLPFERIALSPFARRLVGATATTMSIVDVERRQVLETIQTGHNGISALCYSSDGLRALSAGQDGRLRLWRVEDDDAKAGKL